MKTTYKYLSLALASVAMTGCADLDTVYLGSVVSSEQKQQVLEQNPDMALASVTGCFQSFLNTQFDSNDQHYQFSYPSLMIGFDQQGQDMGSKGIGYNWYADWLYYDACNNAGAPTGYLWLTMYEQIGVCNTLIASIPEDTDDNKLMFFRAQGTALRAFDYWVLAQCYQYNYTVNPDAPCVPIITEKNSDQAAVEGCPRNSVKEVYDQVLSDINYAIDALSKSPVTPASVISSKPKRAISLAVAYGIRARINLTMHKYAEAAADAQAAISNFTGAPYSRAEVSKPAFVKIEDGSWMWGVAVAETDRVSTSGICNFPSMMGSLAYGYCTVGAWRWCNYKLYASIPASDVRKGWFLDENFQSPNLSEAQQEYIMGYVTNPAPTPDDKTAALMPYTQVKYDAYNGELGSSTNASDIPLMRVEEMYLIQAEATGMSQGPAAGKSLLENFVKTYRDPKYICDATDADTFQDECWRQRRIELWGEGFSYFDIMRLKKGVDRVGAGFPAQVTYKLAPDAGQLLYCIPIDEINTNKQISQDDNNPDSDVPEPVK